MIQIQRLPQGSDRQRFRALFLEDRGAQIIQPRIELVDSNRLFRPLKGRDDPALIGQGLRQQDSGLAE